MFTIVRNAAMFAGQIITCACIPHTVRAGMHVVQIVV